MISKNQIQFIKSLQNKKERSDKQIFTAEGSRLILDLIKTAQNLVKHIYCTETWFKDYETKLSQILGLVTIIHDDELKKIASLKTTEQVIGLFKFPELTPSQPDELKLSLYLDDLKDPGNMGTIFRLADWFGITHIFGGESCVDPFNNKSIQASMSSISRVTFQSIPFQQLKADFTQHKFIATGLLGVELKDVKQDDSSKIICIGNEAHGLSEEIAKLCDITVSISSKKSLGAESLNAAIASGILLQHFS